MPNKRKTALPAEESKTFTVDCSIPARDGLFVTQDFHRFLTQNMKVGGKKYNLENIKITTDESNKILFEATVPISKRYIKFLTKKYLNKNHLKDVARVSAPNGRNNDYIIKYYHIMNNDEVDNSDMEE